MRFSFVQAQAFVARGPRAASVRTLIGFVVIVSTLLAVRSQGAAEGLPGPNRTWTLAAVGDAIINRRIALFENEQDPRFKRVVEIIRGADAAMVNYEQSSFRASEFKGWAEVENGGNWEVGPPETILDLKAMGFDLFNRANNHTTDYGVEGMRLTNKYMEDYGVVFAGAGENLGLASRPGYLDTTKGRVALIGLAATFTPMSRAGESRDDMRGRPGLNALRIERKYQADEPTMKTLREFAGRVSDGRGGEGGGNALRLFGTQIEPGPTVKVTETVNPLDEERILHEVRNAASLADYVVVTMHSHEAGNNPDSTSAWLREFAKKCLDAGASTFVMHGPHQLRGIEIYRGRPIFYGLGNFVFQNETIDPMPSDHYDLLKLPGSALAADLYDARFKNGTTGFPASPIYYESVVAVPTFRGKDLIELRLYPIDLAQKAPRSQRGTPRLADETTGRKILQSMAEMSKLLGTTLTEENGVGVWRGTK